MHSPPHPRPRKFRRGVGGSESKKTSRQAAVAELSDALIGRRSSERDKIHLFEMCRHGPFKFSISPKDWTTEHPYFGYIGLRVCMNKRTDRVKMCVNLIPHYCAAHSHDTVYLAHKNSVASDATFASSGAWLPSMGTTYRCSVAMEGRPTRCIDPVEATWR